MDRQTSEAEGMHEATRTGGGDRNRARARPPGKPSEKCAHPGAVPEQGHMA